MTRNSNELGAIGATGRKATRVRRPFLVGALAAGVIALGASTAVAVGPFGESSSGPSTVRGQGITANMMSGGAGADMMSGGAGADMMKGGAGADMMKGGAGPNMMG